jgi:outer membrane protein OmpA-like peptidoglycan-associated protein
MPLRPAKPWRGAVFAAALGGVVLVAAAGFAFAEEPTREQIIESLRAKQLTRCPRFDPKAGCGAPQPAGGIDVEIHFRPGSVGLGAAAVSQLEKLGTVLRKPEQKGAALVVTGHTDARGSEEYNQHLSKRRAEAVKRFLVGTLKLPDDHVVAVGYGKTQAKNAADPFARENRRVQIVKADAK